MSSEYESNDAELLALVPTVAYVRNHKQEQTDLLLKRLREDFDVPTRAEVHALRDEVFTELRAATKQDAFANVNTHIRSELVVAMEILSDEATGEQVWECPVQKETRDRIIMLRAIKRLMGSNADILSMLKYTNVDHLFTFNPLHGTWHAFIPSKAIYTKVQQETVMECYSRAVFAMFAGAMHWIETMMRTQYEIEYNGQIAAWYEHDDSMHFHKVLKRAMELYRTDGRSKEEEKEWRNMLKLTRQFDLHILGNEYISITEMESFIAPFREEDRASVIVPHIALADLTLMLRQNNEQRYGPMREQLAKNFKLVGDGRLDATLKSSLIAIKANKDFVIKMNRGVKGCQSEWIPCADRVQLNMRTGEVRERTQRDYWSHFVPCQVYDDYMTRDYSEMIEKLMPICCGDEVMLRDFQNVLGYVLTGESSGQAFAVWYGNGANGKSTIVDIMKALLGDCEDGMCATADSSLITRPEGARRPTDANAARPEIVRLVSKRMVIVTEFNDNLDYEFLKRWTGGDAVTGRGLYSGSIIEYIPMGTVVALTNSVNAMLPGNAYAVERRYYPFTFRATFTKDEGSSTSQKADHNFAKKFIDKHLTDFFNWLLVGARRFYDEGLRKSALMEHRMQELNEVGLMTQEMTKQTFVESLFEFDAEHAISPANVFHWLQTNMPNLDERVQRFMGKNVKSALSLSGVIRAYIAETPHRGIEDFTISSNDDIEKTQIEIAGQMQKASRKSKGYRGLKLRALVGM